MFLFQEGDAPSQAQAEPGGAGNNRTIGRRFFSRGHSTSRIIVQRNQSEGSKGTFPSAFGLCRIYAVLSPCCLVYMITCMLLSPCGFVWACAANVAGQEVNQGHRSPVQDG